MNDVSFQWMDFDTNADQILKMRHDIFVKEYCMNRITTMSTKDEGGVHLAMFDGDTLIGVISGYFFDRHHVTVSQYELPICDGIYFQVAKLAARSSNRIYAPGLCLLYALIGGVSEQISFDMILTFLHTPQFKQSSWYHFDLGFEHSLIRRYNYYPVKILYGTPSVDKRASLRKVGFELPVTVPLLADVVHKPALFA